MSEKYTSEQAEQLYNDAMSEAPSESSAGQQQSVEPTQAEQEMFDIKWGGEVKQFDRSKTIDFAQQGYDYAKKMHDHKVQQSVFEQEKSTWQKEQETLNSRYAELKQIDDYARQNPQWLQKVQSEYQNVQGDQDYNNPVVSKLQNEIQSIKEGLDKQREHQDMTRRAEEDAALDASITYYRGKNTNFDWEATDPVSGMKLDQQILQHAQSNGINNFKAAANDYLFDQLIKQASEGAKESVAKSIQQDTLLGLGAKTSESRRLVKPAANLRAQSYEDLTRQALGEIYGS